MLHGGVQPVVQGAQHADQALLMQQLVFGGQRVATAQLGQHVVQAGARDGLERGLAGFAVGVDLLGQTPDLRGQRGVRPVSSAGKGKVSKHRVLMNSVAADGEGLIGQNDRQAGR